MKNPVFALFAAIVASLAISSTASAQATTSTITVPKFEFSGGYQLYRVGQVCDSGAITQTCTANRTFPLGFAFDVARNFGSIGIVGEGGWSSDAEDDLDFKTWHLAGGARWTSRRLEKLWPYGHFLLGMVQDRVSGSFQGADVDRSATNFMVQPGAGVTYVLGAGWGVTGQIDYRRVFLNSDEELSSGRNDFRMFIGVRLMR